MRNKLFSTLLFIAMCVVSQSSVADTFNPTTGQLNIDSVVVGDTLFQNVGVGISQVFSVGSATPINRATAASTTVPTNACNASHLNLANFTAIQAGQSFAQLLTILNCAPMPGYTAGSYLTSAYDSAGQRRYSATWQMAAPGSIKTISVFFDSTGTVVAPYKGEFKEGVGL
jgi:hypothetical protein